MYRIGVGYDSHRTIDGRTLILGGEYIPFSAGLKGHSDGDCLLHAVCDAILGALGEGDMGRHFPSRDPQWKGTPSVRFLERVAALMAEKGYAVGNLDATVIATNPHIAVALADHPQLTVDVVEIGRAHV